MAGPVAGYLNNVRVRSDATAATSSDNIDGIKDFSLSLPVDLLETTNFKPGNGVKTRIGGLQDSSADVNGDYLAGDTVQTILRTAWTNRTAVYLTVILDGTASAGSQGFRIPMLVSEYSSKSSPSGLCEFSAKLMGNGVITAV